MAKGVAYEIGVQRAREQQKQGIGDPVQWQQELLRIAALRDVMRQYADEDNLEEALARHLDGYLSVWD